MTVRISLQPVDRDAGVSPAGPVDALGSAVDGVPNSVPATLLALDELLFRPRSWFAIGDSNRRVPGVFPGTLAAGLDLVGRGGVAAIVGRLRPQVVAVDIDAGGRKFAEAGALALEEIVAWCRARRVWHLVRESGRGFGHWHVVTVPGVHELDLVELVAGLRRTLTLPGRALDVRRDGLRPLSSPHRTTGPTPVPEGAVEALESLRAVLDASTAPATSGRRRRGGSRTRARAGVGVGPLAPMARPPRALPAGWEEYLTQGRGAAAARGLDRSPEEDSMIELEATFQFVITGHSAQGAWERIEGSHGDAFVKAKRLGESWWWTVWNAAVRAADDWRAEHLGELTAAGVDVVDPAAGTEEQRAARVALEGAWARICEVWLGWPAATRHTDLEVMATIVERCYRLGVTAAQIPQRDLVLDCAVASRATVRAALDRLVAYGVLEIERTYVEGTTDTANTLRVGTDQGPERGPGSSSSKAEPSGVSVISPTCVSHPLPLRPSLPQRRALPSPTTALAWTLQGAKGGLSEDQLLERCGLLRDGQDSTSVGAGQRRSLRARLRVLGEEGLAVVDADGRWHAGVRGSAELGAVGLEAQESAAAAVRAEREAFRDRVDQGRRQAIWQAQRAAALARQRKHDIARRRAWFEALPQHEREERQATWRDRFTQLSATEQATFKQTKALERVVTGVVERERYLAWRDSIPNVEMAHRSVARAEVFARLPKPLQVQLVRDWVAHRRDFNLPDPSRWSPPLPHAEPDRPEDALLHRPVPTVQQLTLFDQAELDALASPADVHESA